MSILRYIYNFDLRPLDLLVTRNRSRSCSQNVRSCMKSSSKYHNIMVFFYVKWAILYCSQLQKDGYAEIVEKLAQEVNITVEKASNDLLHIINSINVHVKVGTSRSILTNSNAEAKILIVANCVLDTLQQLRGGYPRSYGIPRGTNTKWCHQNTYGWQVGSTHPTGRLSC